MRGRKGSWAWSLILGLTLGIPAGPVAAQGYYLTVCAGDTLTVYSYEEGASYAVYDDLGVLMWASVLDSGKSETIPVADGTYLVVGTSPDPTFGVIGGRHPDGEAPAGAKTLKNLTAPAALDEGAEGNLVICVPWQGNAFLSHDTYDGRTITFGEMDPAEKHAISHRADAFRQLVAACFA